MSIKRPDLRSMTLNERRAALRDAVFHAGPEHFDMDAWGYDNEAERDYALYDVAVDDIFEPFAQLEGHHCGTTACLAGTGAVLMGGSAVSSEEYCGEEWKVAEFFGLSQSAFYIEDWSTVRLNDEETLADRFERLQLEGDGDQNRAAWETVLAYLDHLIKTEANP